MISKKQFNRELVTVCETGRHVHQGVYQIILNKIDKQKEFDVVVYERIYRLIHRNSVKRHDYALAIYLNLLNDCNSELAGKAARCVFKIRHKHELIFAAQASSKIISEENFAMF